jgi:hypothetical protein
MAEPFLDFRNAFVAACNTASLGGSLNNVAVVDGPAVSRSSEPQKLWVGTSPGDDTLVAEGANEEGNLPGLVDIETFALICIAEARNDQMSTLRLTVFAIKKAVRDLLRPDASGKTLGVLSIANARPGAWSLEESQTTQGAYVGMTFRIEVTVKPGTY